MLLLLALQIAWTDDLQGALAEAGKSGRLVLLHFYRANSTASERMMKDTFGNPEVVAAYEKTLVHVRLDVAKHEAFALKHGLHEMPACALLTSSGERVTALPGYLGPGGYREAVDAALAAWGKLRALDPKEHAKAAELWAELGEGRKAGEAYAKAAEAAPDAKARGALLAKALDQLNLVPADDAVTARMEEVAAALEKLDPALGFGDDAAYGRAMADYNREDWDAAIAKLEALAERWPEGDRAAPALLGAADLYHHAKKEHAKAIARVKRVIERYRGSWAERAKHLLEHIEAHQEK